MLYSVTAIDITVIMTEIISIKAIILSIHTDWNPAGNRPRFAHLLYFNFLDYANIRSLELGERACIGSIIDKRKKRVELIIMLMHKQRIPILVQLFGD